MIEIRALADEDGADLLPSLSALLVECVRTGASVEFLSTVTLEDARHYWTAALERVAAGQQIRGEISKLLVDPQARRRGIANLLMDAVEAEAWSRGRTVLVLDTVTGSEASHLYERRGWNRVGEIPGYALNPSGELCSTTYYWKQAPGA